jgi:putative oxidoreductase
MIIEATRNTTPSQAILKQSSPARRALHRFFATRPDGTALILRLALAATMFPHGAQKALGWFGGWGFQGTVGAFTQGGMPLPLALAVIAAEFLGPIALVAGFFTRWSAFGIGLTMAGAALMAHMQHGFFMNWMGTQKGEGIEYFIPVVAISLVLMIKGGGSWAIDRLIARKLDSNGSL